MSNQAATSPDRAALAAQFAAARIHLETPESIGRALVNYILGEGAAKGTISADGMTIEVPIVVKLAVPPRQAPGERVVTSKFCFTAFGYDVACLAYTISDT